MTTDDQNEVARFLASPETHGGAVERIDTHASIVFLAGLRAWKMKRAVLYDFLDFSTIDRRRQMCEAEFRLNRRMSPGLYRRVLAVTREPDGRLALGGEGRPLEWVIEMTRFDQAALFDGLAERHALPLEWMQPLGSAIARMHAGAEHRPDRGGEAGMRWVTEGNETGFAEYGKGILAIDVADRVSAHVRRELDRHAAFLDARRGGGFVRQCHGDLHLRNIVWHEGHPTLFDAIEFNEQISCIDVLYDIAFLLMDLWRRQLHRHANDVWNAYVSESAEAEGHALLPLFLACRASVRAKIDALEARVQQDARHRAELEEAARGYLALALDLLEPRPACLLAVGGLSGSGKSTLARALAFRLGPAPGAVIVRSDEVRKRLHNAAAHERLSPDAYTPAATERVYTTVIDRARAMLKAGHSVIVDALFADPAHREAVETAARRIGVPFVGVWLDAPEAALLTRVNHRRHDASDATASVVQAQLTKDIGSIRWPRKDSSGEADEVAGSVMTLLKMAVPAAVDLAP
jgi:aminoglycoside phosphotransferase family enzyme/predicted kinase